MFDRILVAFDGSPPARRALSTAVEIASRFHSAITIAFVRQSNAGPTDTVLESLVPLAGEGKAFGAVVDEARSHALAQGAASVDSLVLGGDVVESLLSWIDRNHPDLVVVGSRGLSRGQRIFQGSVSSDLVNRAACPVLVVRGGRSHAARPDARPGSSEAAGTTRRVS